MSDERFVESIEGTCTKLTMENCKTTVLYGIPIASLVIDCKERLCLAQISNTLLKKFSYNEIHNRRVALGITCVQCTPVQLEILRRAGAMPISSRRCGMITKHEAERLVKSFLEESQPVKLPDNFAFEVKHTCSWGCQGNFIPSRYNSSRAKCIKCKLCSTYLSPNKFIFHSHRLPDSKYQHPDAANFNSWRRHIKLANEDPSNELLHVWEDVKAMFNGGSRKRSLLTCSTKTSVTDTLPIASLAPSMNRRPTRFDAASAYTPIRAPIYPFMTPQFIPKPFQNVSPDTILPLIPPHRLRMEPAEYNHAFPLSSWKMPSFWLNSQMMGGPYFGKMPINATEVAWQDLHSGSFRPLSSSSELDVSPVSKMIHSHHVSAFNPVDHISEMKEPLVKMNYPSRFESPSKRRNRMNSAPEGSHTQDLHKFGFHVQMGAAAAAEQINITKCRDTLDGGEGVGFALPIRTKEKDSSLQIETGTPVPILKMENKKGDEVSSRNSRTTKEHDMKQITRSELEAKLEEAQTTLMNQKSSPVTSEN